MEKIILELSLTLMHLEVFLTIAVRTIDTYECNICITHKFTKYLKESYW